MFYKKILTIVTIFLVGNLIAFTPGMNSVAANETEYSSVNNPDTYSVTATFDTQTLVLPVCVMPPSGLTSWWPGEGNANDVMMLSNGFLMGGASFAP